MPVPKGYLMGTLPQLLWQACDEIREGNRERKMAVKRDEEESVISIVMAFVRKQVRKKRKSLSLKWRM